MNGNSATRIALLLVALAVGACGEKADTTAADKAKAEAQARAAAEAQAQAAAAAAGEKEGLEAGVEVVAYRFPLVILDATCRKLSNVTTPGPMAAPVNQFANMPQFPDASFRDVVRANVDTLYSSACLDLSREPIVLSVPDTKGRHCLMPMLDTWTNVFASPGKRTTAPGPGISRSPDRAGPARCPPACNS